MGDHEKDTTALHTLEHWDEFCDQCAGEARERDEPPAKTLRETLDEIGHVELTDEDRKRAHSLVTELSTRITSAPLRYRDGDEAAALSSLHKVFVKTREEMVASDGAARGFSNVGQILLERILRPFTGRWHGRLLRGALERQDERRRFRIELRGLRDQLDLFRSVLGRMAGDPLVPLPAGQVTSRANLGSLWPDGYIGPTPPRIQESEAPSLAEELAQIATRRGNAYATRDEQTYGGLGPDGDRSVGLVGLALSGGGIRSATFCLGVIQCLARHGVLRDVDYLSTVSGGGYMGSFLSSRLHRRARDLKPGVYESVLDDILIRPDGRTGDSSAVRWLRNNSKYLLSRDAKERRQTIFHVAKGLLPGGSSLHALYRDRLARGYIHEDDKASLPVPPVSELTGHPAPFHLINTAVNLPASKNAELRGRRSDFFVISPLHTGSVVTGYCKTTQVETFLGSGRDRFDLASAMAISGAAVSSHMGTKNYGGAARAALVAANVRLGHWLPNPGRLADDDPPGMLSIRGSRWRELRGNFDETEAFVNLSDGGHVENLGLYELLRRRCKFIVVVDGECDPDRTSGALVKAARLAKIDMGVDIQVDVSDLHTDENERSQTHWAFGKIDYNPGGGDKEIGYLLYLKLSITGNEPDYVKEYRSRHPAFPHQSTADQIFDEDQFEAYRALGEHAASDLFGSDVVTAAQLKSKTHRTRAWLEALVREFL